MNDHDRAFLRDVRDVISLNRIVDVYALRRQYLRAEEAGTEALAALNEPGLVNNIVDKTLSAYQPIAAQRKTGDTLRKILLAKMFVELMSAYEDLAALCLSIKHRNNPVHRKYAGGQIGFGVFGVYLACRTQHVKQFIEDLESADPKTNPGVTLDSFLSLPPLNTFARYLVPTLRTGVERYYAQLLPQLQEIFGEYRERMDPQLMRITRDLPATDMADAVMVVLDLVKPGDSPIPNNGFLVTGFNKLKHRFLMTERLRDYRIEVQAGASDLYDIVWL